MSFNATAWAWKQTHIKGTAKLVLLALADCLNEASGQCNPGRLHLQRMTGLSPRTITRGVHELEDMGVVYVKRTSYVNQYDLLGFQDSANLAPPSDTLALDIVSDWQQGGRQNGTTEVPNRHHYITNQEKNQEPEPEPIYGAYNGTLTPAMLEENLAKNAAKLAEIERRKKNGR